MRLLTTSLSRPSQSRRRALRLERLEDRSLLAAGVLDTSFDVDGFAVTAVGSGQDEAASVAVQADGKVVVAGRTMQSNGYFAAAFTRYNTNGSLDKSFGNNGKAIVAFGTANAGLGGISIRPDGKIVGVGTVSGTSIGVEPILVRLNPNGSLDTTFGDVVKNKPTGKVQVSLTSGENAQAYKLVLQSDGAIVVAGNFSSSAYTSPPTGDDFAVFRFTAAGKLDTTFNGKGYVTTDINGGSYSSDRAIGVTLQADGKIVAAGWGGVQNPDGSTTRNFALVRYNTNGTLDTTFGVGGKSLLAGLGLAGTVDIQPLPTGSFRIVAGGSLFGGSGEMVMSVVAYDPSGNLDPTFGTNGVTQMATFQLSSGLSGTLGLGRVEVQPDGKIVVGATGSSAGSPSSGYNNFGMLRLTANGAVDNSFADNGLSFTELVQGKPIQLTGIALAPDGRIVAAGVYNFTSDITTRDFLVARYLGDSALLAAGRVATTPANTDSLAVAQVQSVLNQAIARWEATGADVAGLGSFDVRIADLEGAILGLAAGNTITLDVNAAGWGWFVDATPSDDSEFTTPGNQGEQNRMDLLTVLMHELGHLLGHGHDSNGVMAETLAVGERQADHVASTDELFAQSGNSDCVLPGDSLAELLASTQPGSKRRR